MRVLPTSSSPAGGAPGGAVPGRERPAGGPERGRRSRPPDAFNFAPMIIPVMVLAIALLSFYNVLNMTLGLHPIILSHEVFSIAFFTVGGGLGSTTFPMQVHAMMGFGVTPEVDATANTVLGGKLCPGPAVPAQRSRLGALA